MSSHESFPRPHQGPFADALPTPEQDAPNQPFHDLLHDFVQDILRGAQESFTATGMFGYPRSMQETYERRIDQLLADRDAQRGG